MLVRVVGYPDRWQFAGRRRVPGKRQGLSVNRFLRTSVQGGDEKLKEFDALNLRTNLLLARSSLPASHQLILEAVNETVVVSVNE